MMHCKNGGKTTPPGGVSSALKERSSSSALVNNQDHSSALMDGSLVLSPNGKSNTGQNEMVVKDLVPYGQTTSLVELEEGIGIVKFLKGKSFFVTGATGFLAKGTDVLYVFLNIFRIKPRETEREK